MRIQLSFAVLFAAVFACSMYASSAQAQRVFVSATGSDGNPCSFASPCRSFQHAHDVAPAHGEIDVLDPAGYGAVTITKAISIQGHGFSGITVAGGANGITINAGSSDAITLNGLILDGANVGFNGIVFNSGSSLAVSNCVVQNFFWNGSSGFSGSIPGNGVLIQPTSGAVKFVITNTIVSNNGSIGIFYVPPSGSATAAGVIDQVVATNNRYGIVITTQNGGGPTTTAISNSIASNSTIVGIIVNNIAALAVSMDNIRA